jgi:hypothetical protein
MVSSRHSLRVALRLLRRLMPGFKRPIMRKVHDAALPAVNSSGFRLSGTQSSLWFTCPGIRGNSKLRGITPITV